MISRETRVVSGGIFKKIEKQEKELIEEKNGTKGSNMAPS